MSGIAAAYHMPNVQPSALLPDGQTSQTSRLLLRLLIGVQNRGEFAAGMTSYDPSRERMLSTHRGIGFVSDAFRLYNRENASELLDSLNGIAAIGHTRYATVGSIDIDYAQPEECKHGDKLQWFAFAMDGQMANYAQLAESLLADERRHLSRRTDAEVVVQLLQSELAISTSTDLVGVLRRLAPRFDGAFNLALLNGLGDMIVARDPLGFRPLAVAFDGALFCAASESSALAQLGFPEDRIHDLEPGTAAVIRSGE